jgi:hypothetical protein
VLEVRRLLCNFTLSFAGVAELADALDSKSSDRKIVWVRSPPPAMPLQRRVTSVNSLNNRSNPIPRCRAQNAQIHLVFVN